MTSKVKVIETGYSPRPLQKGLHSKLKRFNVIVAHRRFGKSVFSINEILDQSLRCQRKNPRYAYIAPLYSQAKRVAWDYLKQYALKIPGATANEAELRVDIPRPALDDSIRIFLLGGENPDAIRGIYLDGVVLDEFGDMDPQVWSKVVRPALSDREGWAIFIGTPKGKNAFYELFTKAQTPEFQRLGWFSAMHKASETGLLSPLELEAARLEMDQDEYEQEYECSFLAGITGAYYARQMQQAENEGRITSVPYDPALLVDTYWDLGIGDTNVIWFIQNYRDMQYRVIDYIEESGLGLEDYIRRLRERPYVYGQHTLPHDAAARELGTGKARVEVFRELGLKQLKVLERTTVDDGINAVRMVLGKCFFDAKKTERGREALTNYCKKWDPKNKVFSNTPLHNWASHGADAFRTFAMGVRPYRAKDYVNQLPTQAVTDYDLFGHQ